MELFSISAFVITLRETMEAALVVGIVFAYLTRMNYSSQKKQAWLGVLTGILVSFLGGVIVYFTLGTLDGTAEKVFDGTIMIVASLMLAWMIIWMFHSSFKLQYEIQDKVDESITNQRSYGVFVLVFIAVIREGIETVLFLTGANADASENFIGLMIGGLSGIIIAAALAVLLFKGSVNLNLKKFFNSTSVILIFFAAGLLSHAIHEFQELGVFGAENSEINKQLWSTKAVLDDTNSTWGLFLRVLFGYQDTPSLLELVTYILFWIGIGITFMSINRKFKSQHLPAIQ